MRLGIAWYKDKNKNNRLKKISNFNAKGEKGFLVWSRPPNLQVKKNKSEGDRGRIPDNARHSLMHSFGPSVKSSQLKKKKKYEEVERKNFQSTSSSHWMLFRTEVGIAMSRVFVGVVVLPRQFGVMQATGVA